MSQGTPVNKLNNSMNDDDSRLVDSILNDLNNKPTGPSMGQGPSMGPSMGQGPSMPQAGGPPQQMSPEQHKMMLAQRQQAMMQQQMMMQQQATLNQNKKEVTGESIIEKLQDNWKSLLIIFVLCVAMNLEVVDNLFKLEGVTMFLTETGGLNIQASFIKSIAVVLVFFIINALVPI
jgi:hypothetical protein